MEQACSTKPRFYLEAIFAAYTSLLIGFAVVCRPPYAWTLSPRYYYIWHPHAIALGTSDFLLTHLTLFLVPALGIFLAINVLGLFLSAWRGVLLLMMLVAVIGFPIVCLYAQWKTDALAELAFVILTLILWVQRKWRFPSTANVGLLLVHFVFWFLFCVPLLGLEIGRERWQTWDYLLFLYPALGFACALISARLYKTSSGKGQ